MKINIIGGGPSGFYFAILMKKSNAANQITVYERNGPDDTFGWGVVFSGKTLANLRVADPESHAEITKSFEAWDNVDVVHRDEKVSIHGNSFSGIARLQLLKILQRRCEELGVDLRFRTEISDIESLRGDCDLLVAADGVNSTVRRQYSNLFIPHLDTRPNRYIWYGTNRLFHGLTLTFRASPAGVFAAHSYKFNETTSTFIIECDEQTWNAARFADMGDSGTRAYLERVFEADLNGQPLLSNKSNWVNFLLVKNEHWYFDNLAMLGDALHTAHFSIGSGTKLALEDAIALHQCFTAEKEIANALSHFESTRKPVIEAYQAAAFDSMRWFENARDYMNLSPIEMAYALMTRSGRVDDEALRQRDPEFMEAHDRLRTNCFSGSVKVRTEVGWKPIESIRPGERVWTHRGRLRSVVGLQERAHVGRLLGLRLQGCESVVWCTPEQSFLQPYSPSPQAERGAGGEECGSGNPTPNPSPLAGRGKKASIHQRLGGSNPALLVLSRKLRVTGTTAEILLWERIRGRRLCGAKFRRQHSLGAHYIVDFYCAKAHLAVELDGSVHDADPVRWADGIRHRQIQQAGVHILRFRNERIMEDMEGVLAEIAEHLNFAPPQAELENETWSRADTLESGAEIVIDGFGNRGVLELVDALFVRETVYDLTVEEDHSFITQAGVVR